MSVVVLNWNGGQDVLECLAHVAAQAYPLREVIVVDNGSHDGSLQTVREHYPEAIVCENTRNLGYAAGMNAGIRRASGEFVVLLNQDAFPDPHYLERGVQLLQACPSAAMVAGTVVRTGRGGLADEVASRGFMMRWHMRPTPSTSSAPGSIVLGPSFACAMIRRAALDDVRCPSFGDYLDEDYFAYHEDIDLCFRIALRGWQVVYSPDLVARHRQGSATGGNIRAKDKPPFFQRHVFKNRYLTTVKDLPAGLLIQAVPLMLAGDALMLLYLLLTSPRSLWAWLLACTDVARLLPRALTRRRAIQSRRTITVRELRRYFVRL